MGAARAAAEELGCPVVIKPCDADYGHGVSLRLTSVEQVEAAYFAARHWSEQVLVERFVPGTLYRLLVVNGQLIAAVRREPSFVVGDGYRTIRELLVESSDDPARGGDCPSPWIRLQQTRERLPVVAADGSANDSIPSAGLTVPLVGDIYMRSGGKQRDRTDEVHPQIAQLAIDAAHVVGLDIAGLDVIAEDVT